MSTGRQGVARQKERVLMYIYHVYTYICVQVGGVLRGRWNVYYSEDTQKERFWMQVFLFFLFFCS